MRALTARDANVPPFDAAIATVTAVSAVAISVEFCVMIGVRMEQPVRQTSTMLAVRRAYELIPGPCATCPHRRTLVRAVQAGA